MQVEAEQAFQREIALSNPRIGSMGLPVKGQDQGRRMLCHRPRRVSGNTRHLDVEFFGGIEVDIVEAGAAQGHQPDTLFMEHGQGGAVYTVVDERTDGRCALRERRRVSVEMGLEKVYLVGALGDGVSRH